MIGMSHDKAEQIGAFRNNIKCAPLLSRIRPWHFEIRAVKLLITPIIPLLPRTNHKAGGSGGL